MSNVRTLNSFAHNMADLEIAEIPYPSGQVKFRYARYLSADGTKWIRHGLFQAFHENGALASEGSYEHGVEHGPWRDFHQNSLPAAEGLYERGQEVGAWRYWNEDGSPNQ